MIALDYWNQKFQDLCHEPIGCLVLFGLYLASFFELLQFFGSLVKIKVPYSKNWRKAQSAYRPRQVNKKRKKEKKKNFNKIKNKYKNKNHLKEFIINVNTYAWRKIIIKKKLNNQNGVNKWHLFFTMYPS